MKTEIPKAVLHSWSLDCCILDYFVSFWKFGFEWDVTLNREIERAFDEESVSGQVLLSATTFTATLKKPPHLAL